MGKKVCVSLWKATGSDPSYFERNRTSQWQGRIGNIAEDIRSPFADILHMAIVDEATGKILWDQMVFDEKPSVNILVVNNSGEIGLVWATRPVPNVSGWEIPRGFSKEKESPKDTAIREMKEEFGNYEIGHIALLKQKHWLRRRFSPMASRLF